MHDKTNIFTYGLSCKKRLYSGLKSSYSNDLALFALYYTYSVSLCEKTTYGILFTFNKLGILMQFSCYHMPYVSNNVQIGALRRPIQGENIIFIQVLHHDP